MKKRNITRLAILILIAIAGFFAVVWFTLPNHNINRGAFERLEFNMSRAEVEAILKCPPGNYCSAGAMGEITLADGSPGGIAIREVFDEVLAIRGDDAVECFRPAIWASDNGMIVVVFDVNDTITKKDFLPIHVTGIVAKIRRWLMSR
jgi:hypothetical protein